MLPMTTFQRARSEEQREVRRRAILDTAAAMLAEMPVAEVTLNELSRRVGLAKSNVLRYFESREAVLLELLDSAWQEWLTGLEAGLGGAIDAAALPAERGDQLAAALAASLAARPVLCDLLSAQAAVLERNVSPQVAAAYKRAALADVGWGTCWSATWASSVSTTRNGSAPACSWWRARCGRTPSRRLPCSRPTRLIPPWLSCGPTSSRPCVKCSKC
jgi:AcrR family transcriptional regulator